ncbi:non-specific serine/threonine protein kinase [Entamoeba marina]
MEHSFKVANKYELVRKLGSGSFGDIYMAINIFQPDDVVAIKLEKIKLRHPQLRYEYNLYKYFNEIEMKNIPGIPYVRYWGCQEDYNVMVMEYLGPSLEDLFVFCGKKFSLKTTLMLADQCLKRTQFIHSKDYIHRDIKPDNFVMGRGNQSNIVYSIDFGLAKKYREQKTKKHIKYSEDKSLVGTARYASLNNHYGKEQSRRDDMESLAYMFINFMTGPLPWQGLKGNNKRDKYAQILAYKESLTCSKLCEGIPEEFALFLNYCRHLGFEEEPDYFGWRKKFWKLAKKEGIVYDGIFDWLKYKEK